MYFPEIRSGESIYSILSRIQFALQPPNYEVLGKMLFGRRFETGRLNFQTSFDFLCSNLPKYYTPENFLYNNTILPYYLPFITDEKKDTVLNYFKGNYPDRIQKCLGISEITGKRAYIRICKECVREDFTKYGEPFYRRQHEIEINRICSVHKVPLYECEIFPYKIPSRFYDFFTVLDGAKLIEIPEKFYSKMVEIGEDIAYLFSIGLKCNLNTTRERITNKLIDTGYTTINIIQQKKFSIDFKSYYTDEFLDYLGVNIDADDNDSWIRHVSARKKAVTNPIKYILAIKFLFGSLENFFTSDINIRSEVFKPGPYPCLNVLCPDYKELVIDDVDSHYSHGYILGNFRCKRCGFTYSRRGSDYESDDIYTKTRVQQYGHLWHRKIDELLNNGYNPSELSRMTGVNRSRIYQHMKGNINIFYSDIDSKRLDECRKRLAQIIKENPHAGRSYYNKNCQSDYRYVLENDKDWIDKNIKKNKKKEKRKGEFDYISYWSSKDLLLSIKVESIIDNIKSKHAFYERITISIVQKYIGFYNFYPNRSKLPKCFEILDRECESRIDYQKRRVDYVMHNMAQNTEKITYNKVLHSTGLGRYKDSEINEYIMAKIKEYNLGIILEYEH